MLGLFSMSLAGTDSTLQFQLQNPNTKLIEHTLKLKPETCIINKPVNKDTVH